MLMRLYVVEEILRSFIKQHIDWIFAAEPHDVLSPRRYRFRKEFRFEKEARWSTAGTDQSMETSVMKHYDVAMQLTKRATVHGHPEPSISKSSKTVAIVSLHWAIETRLRAALLCTLSVQN